MFVHFCVSLTSEIDINYDILANLHQENRSIYDINKNDFCMGIQKIVLETIQ